MQVNLGYKCNQACKHCHVDASPSRTEMMSYETISLIPKVISRYGIQTLDITGGAPEMHPNFTDLILSVGKLNIEIIDRCNLTILKEPGQENMARFLASNKVKIIASLPCYEEENVDNQRGKGVFSKSLESLRDLNKLGYGLKGTGLFLDLVFNPQGDQLPPPQLALEDKYRKELLERYGISFNHLLVIANMPINRFAIQLEKENKLESYKSLLKRAHNPLNLKSLMCLETISVDWRGFLYDCDFNQQLGIGSKLKPNSLEELARNKVKVEDQSITVDEHCYGCTAGSGSSCGGALLN